MSRTVAAVDCGTNSVRLLVLRRLDDGTVEELTRQTRLARLGQGGDATGEFHPDALERTFAVVDEYAALIAGLGVDEVRFVATSAARDVSNRDVFFDGPAGRSCHVSLADGVSPYRATCGFDQLERPKMIAKKMNRMYSAMKTM